MNQEVGEQDHTLHLLRHAKSSWRHPVDDHDRPLNDRGERDARAIGRLLAERGWWPDLVLCSTAARARLTWDRASGVGAAASDVRFVERIYGASASELSALLHEIPDAVRSCLIVGHAPGVPELARRLVGSLDRNYPTAGLATIRLTGPWSAAAHGELVSFDVPRG